jgi:hypothetical protein
VLGGGFIQSATAKSAMDKVTPRQLPVIEAARG